MFFNSSVRDLRSIYLPSPVTVGAVVAPPWDDVSIMKPVRARYPTLISEAPQ